MTVVHDAITGEIIHTTPEDMFVHTEVGVLKIGKPRFDDWFDTTEDLLLRHGANKWAIGDMLLYGETDYGDLYTQWESDDQFAIGTLRNMRWVASRFPHKHRAFPGEVPYSWHQDAAGVDDDEARFALIVEASERRLKEHFTRQDFRARVREVKGLVEPGVGHLYLAISLPRDATLASRLARYLAGRLTEEELSRLRDELGNEP